MNETKFKEEHTINNVNMSQINNDILDLSQMNHDTSDVSQMNHDKSTQTSSRLVELYDITMLNRVNDENLDDMVEKSDNFEKYSYNFDENSYTYHMNENSYMDENSDDMDENSDDDFNSKFIKIQRIIRLKKKTNIKMNNNLLKKILIKNHYNYIRRSILDIKLK